MHEIEELERAWRRYTWKRRMPYLAAGFLLLGAVSAWLLLPGIVPFQSSDNRTNPVIAEKPVQTLPSQKIDHKPQIESESLRPEKEKQPSADNTSAAVASVPPKSERKSVRNEGKVVLAPDTGFLENFSDASVEVPERGVNGKVRQSSVRQEIIPRVPRAAPAERAKKTISRPNKSIESKEEETVEESNPNRYSVQKGKRIEISTKATEKSSVVSIQSKKTNNTLNFLIKRFNDTRDPKLAAYIAQSFFKKGNYKETVRWSIIANSLEPANEASWILFAKAKMKLGQKEDAVRALKIYLNQYPSRKVRSYLETLESGL